VLVYVDRITDRLRYTFEFVFEAQEIPFEITDNYGRFISEQGLKFNYSNIDNVEVPSLVPSNLLFETAIRNYNLNQKEFKNEFCLTFDGVLDPVASIFFVLSRYEEYLAFQKDQHNRFSSVLSISNKYGWLDKLICERWVKDLLNFIYSGNDQVFVYTPRAVKTIPTFDIDNAFAYKHKPILRRILSFSKDAIYFDFSRIQQRRKVLKSQTNDPYNTYDKIKQISKSYPVYIFWLLGNYGKYDKNLPHNNFQQQKLIRKLSGFSTIGIHPSYLSNTKPEQLPIEIERLSGIINSKVNCSRQHFLKLSLPETYSNLIKQGIEHDFTMGYADHIGFRSGTVRPHKWFDLSDNKTTSLVIHPFTYMDGTLNEYMNLSIEDSKIKIKELYKEIEKFGGEFLFIWHNETINNLGKWKEWDQVLNFTLNISKNDK
jgi:hypothetical protein